jgi:hypothetical protein
MNEREQLNWNDVKHFLRLWGLLIKQTIFGYKGEK